LQREKALTKPDQDLKPRTPQAPSPGQVIYIGSISATSTPIYGPAQIAVMLLFYHSGSPAGPPFFCSLTPTPNPQRYCACGLRANPQVKKIIFGITYLEA
jgi:hypothetical protein